MQSFTKISVDREAVRLRGLQESFRTNVVSFEDMAGLTAEMVRNSNNPDPKVLLIRDISALTIQAMRRMNEQYPGLPPDSLERTLELLTHPGSKTVTLTGIIPEEEKRGVQLLGYGIMMLGKKNIIDAYHIPPELLQNESASRIIRLFVSDRGREYFPRGDAFSRIIDQVKILVGSGPGIGMVLTGITTENLNVLSGQKPAIWLEAQHALETRGFDTTGKGLTETIAGEQDKKIHIDFKWYVWPPFSDEAKERLADRSRIQRNHAYENLGRLAHVTPILSPSGDVVLVSARAKHSFDLARLYPENLMLAPAIDNQAGRIEKAVNLIPVAKADASSLEPESLNASIIIGTTPDIIGQNADKNRFKLYVAQQHHQLKEGGFLLVRDSVAPAADRLVTATFSTQKTVTSDVSVSDAFSMFVQTAVEKHISRESWDSVTLLRSETANTKSWLAPLAIVQEFNLKLPYFKDWDWERNRPYAAISAIQRNEIISGCGYRILYDAPLPALSDGSLTLAENRSDANYQTMATFKPDGGYHVTLAEKVHEKSGVKIIESGRRTVFNGNFLQVKSYFELNANRATVGATDLAVRLNSTPDVKLITHDIVPYVLQRGQLFIVGRMTPRPLLSINSKTLDGSTSGPYYIEQMGAVVDSNLLADTTSAGQNAFYIIKERGGIEKKLVKRVGLPTNSFTRPDSVDELVVTQAVELSDFPGDFESQIAIYHLDTKPKGKIVEATSYLQGCQIGAFQDGRLERQLYALCQQHAIDAGVWLGERFTLASQVMPQGLQLADVSNIFAPASGHTFKLRNSPVMVDFLSVVESQFIEKAADGTIVGDAVLEHVTPATARDLSNDTITALPFFVSKGSTAASILDSVYVGLECRNYASVFNHFNNSALYTVPTFRVPSKIEGIAEAKSWIRDSVEHEFVLKAQNVWSLGGKYRTSPGNTAELIYPMLVEVDAQFLSAPHLSWVSLAALLKNAEQLACAQLRTSIYRAAHAFESMALA